MWRYVFGGIAIILAILAAVLYICGNEGGRILSAIATVASVSMSISALYYSSKTSAQTAALLKEIEAQNKSFVSYVKQELIKNSYEQPTADSHIDSV